MSCFILVGAQELLDPVIPTACASIFLRFEARLLYTATKGSAH